MPLTPTERKGLLMAAGSGVRQLAEELGYRSHSVVSLVVQGKLRSLRVEQAIADRIGRPVEEVFEPFPVAAATGSDT